jgi:hypothetical protein
MAQELYQLGYDLENIKILAGGTIRWEELKYPLVASN